MDCRYKLLLFLVLIGCVFAHQGLSGFCFLAVVILLFFVTARLPFSIFFRLLRPFFFIFFFLTLINAFIMHEPQGGWHTPENNYFMLSAVGMVRASYISVRVLLMMSLTTILTSTTKPLEITLALEWLFAPLKLVRFPVHIVAIIMTIALRMVPDLLEESRRIMNAQASRGVDFKNGRLSAKVKALVSLIIPLLVSSFQKAEDLAYAMDTRGYNPRQKRTRFHVFIFRWVDCYLFIFFLGLGVISIVNLYYGFLFDPDQWKHLLEQLLNTDQLTVESD